MLRSKGATLAHGNCLRLVFDGLRCPHRAARLGTALALCDRCPCSASLYPPQAALGSAALFGNPFDKILRQTAHSEQSSSHTICRKISLSVSPSSAHVRRQRRILTFLTVWNGLSHVGKARSFCVVP